MDSIFEAFRKAYAEGLGYDLSMTLSPLDTDDEPDRLYKFFKSTNIAQVRKDLQYRILYDNAAPFKLPAEEGNGWVDVYFAYWKFVGEMLNAEHAPKSNAKVRASGSGFLPLIFPRASLKLRLSKPSHVMLQFQRHAKKELLCIDNVANNELT